MNKDIKQELFAFRLSKEKIVEFSQFSAEDKLNWLEDANRLVTDFLSEEKMNRWKKFIERGQQGYPFSKISSNLSSSSSE